MAVETKRSLQEEIIALSGVKITFNILVPNSQAEDWETRMTESRRKAMALCRVQRCFGDRLRRDLDCLLPSCLLVNTI